jgi:hypothetical protein
MQARDSSANSKLPSALGKLPDGSWGLLASSSSRLARDLLLYSFTDLYSTACTMALTSKDQDLEGSQKSEVNSAEGSPTREQRFYTPSQSPPASPPKTTSAVAPSPAYYTPPTSSKVASRVHDEEVEEGAQNQYVFEESKSGRGRGSVSRQLGEGFADVATEGTAETDLTELD